MATLAQKLKLKLGAANIVFVGQPVPSGITSSEGELYYICKLKEPIDVRCTVNPGLPALPVDELYVRESAFNEEWNYADDKKPELGFWKEGWVADFSVNQRIPIYQATTILAYTRTQRGLKKEDRNKALTADIQKQIEAFKAKNKK